MRKISSNYVYSRQSGLLKFGIVEISDQGDIHVVDTGGEMQEIHSLEFYSGILLVGRISSEQFVMLSSKESSLDTLFKLLDSESNSIYLLSNINFVRKCLRTDSRIKKLK